METMPTQLHDGVCTAVLQAVNIAAEKVTHLAVVIQARIIAERHLGLCARTRMASLSWLPANQQICSFQQRGGSGLLVLLGHLASDLHAVSVCAFAGSDPQLGVSGVANDTYHEIDWVEHGNDATLQRRAAHLIKHHYVAYVKH